MRCKECGVKMDQKIVGDAGLCFMCDDLDGDDDVMKRIKKEKRDKRDNYFKKLDKLSVEDRLRRIERALFLKGLDG